MKSIFLAIAALAVVAVVVAVSRPDLPRSGPILKKEPRNPWTGTKFNSDPSEFQFAIVSDRTGSHRPKVFSRAMARLNLLQPEFVLSVGDLIEGGRKPLKQLQDEWAELDRFVRSLQMPFFYVPGNHDVGNKATDDLWKDRLGRRHYHFIYKSVLFLILNTDDPPGSGVGHLDKAQIEDAKRILNDNATVRWTVVALHKPIWAASDVAKTGWLSIEKALAGRPYTVFAGHIHRYQKYVRQGRDYYQLATTGGGSKMRGPAYGEFDHIAWVTMKKSGPVLANILLDAVLPDDLKTPETLEKGVSTKARLPTFPVEGQLLFNGSPAPGAYVVFNTADKTVKKRQRSEGLVEADGSFRLSTYQAFDGSPAGRYSVTVTWRRPFYDAAGKPGPNLLPERYAKAATSGLEFTIKPGANKIVIELEK
jgi:hypothetical protein